MLVRRLATPILRAVAAALGCPPPHTEITKMYNKVSLSLLLLPVLAISSCRALPEVPGTSVRELYSEGGMAAKNPVDIVVAPVMVEANISDVPSEALHSAFAEALIRRRYSPLSPKFIAATLEGMEETPDNTGALVPASYSPGTLGEDAVLRLVVKSWDMSLWKTERKLGVTVDAWMIDSIDPLGTELWGARYDSVLDMSLMQNRFLTTKSMMEYCCGEVARELMDCMPARTARPGL